MTARIICIIQARMGSTRLPGKVLQPILDKPMLWWDVYRVRQARMLDDIVIATTTHQLDDAIVASCRQYGWHVVRGSEEDVLDRYYQAAKQFDAAHIVRITSDCPLIDPQVVDYIVAAHLSSAPLCDYTSNTQPRTYPRGLDTEIFSFEALERTWKRAIEASEREHVTLHIYRNPHDFAVGCVTNPQSYATHRWTVDTPEDLELIRRIYIHFGHGDFCWQDVLGLLAAHPDWVAINHHIEQKKI